VALASYLAKLLFCRGSVCACARADAVFAAFSWVVWTASAAMQSIDLFSGGIKSLKGAKTDEIAVMAMRQEGEKPVTGA
jgi:hypothetical protein